MSELTTCNFCNLRRMKARAKAEGKTVTLLPSSWGGFDVMVHAPHEQVFQHTPDDGNPQWRAWMQEIGDRCEC